MPSAPAPWCAGVFSPIRARSSDLSAPSASPPWSRSLAPPLPALDCSSWTVLSVLSADSTRSWSSSFSLAALSRSPRRPSFAPFSREISSISSWTLASASLAAAWGTSAAAAFACASVAFNRSSRRLFSSRSRSSALEGDGSLDVSTAALWVSLRALRISSRARSFSRASRRALMSASCLSSSSLIFRILSAATLLLSFPMRARHHQPRAKRCMETAARRRRCSSLRAGSTRRAA
mmetsp:Transcript_64157/g.191209  ORF Transcript_64157/g.191209 Transcript_64157/m.191209 type:complete len:235 (+) Transcript_64157:784-1488(+)